MAYTPRGRVFCPQKTTLFRGQLDNVAYIPHGETTWPTANIPTRQHGEGSGRSKKRNVPWASSKREKLILVRFFPDSRTIHRQHATFCFRTRRETSPRMQLFFRGCYRYVHVQRAAVYIGTGTWVSGGPVGGCSVPICYADDIIAAVRV